MSKKKAFNNSEISAFCGQLALILGSGISSLEGIQIMLEDSKTPEEKQILESIKETLEITYSLHQALASTNMFPKYMLDMVLIGEETGKTDEVMEALSKHYQREDQVSKSLRSAITYPLIMSAMMVAVIIILLVKVMPIFNQVFNQLGAEMTGMSALLIKIGSTISLYSIGFSIIAVLLLLIILLAIKTKKGRLISARFFSKFRAIRKIQESTCACRFAGAMALTLSSGLHPDRGLELARELNKDSKFKEKIDAVCEKVNGGADLSESLVDCKVFSGLNSRLALIGQKTGKLDSVMTEIADRYQEEIDSRINNFIAIFEPTIVIALSIIVGIIIMSVMLPLLGIMSSL